MSAARPAANERCELAGPLATQLHAELWHRLRRCELVPDGARNGFVARLARENDWSLEYAQRVCDEYKRFAFLSVVAGHPCTPSDQVDQAWHLHILHTRTYWEVFCPQVLGTSLHHAPTRGGADEASKFRAWYRTTLDSYRAWFADPPPDDIWPSVERRFSLHHVRVQRRAERHDRRLLWLAAGSLATAGCSLVAAVPPFDARGPHFVAFFLVLWAATLVLCAALRVRFAREHAAANIRELGPYEVAHLAGGERAVAHALIATLVQAGALTIDAGRRLFACERGSERSDPLERAVLQRCAGSGASGCSVEGVREVVAANAAQLSAAAERAGLLVPEQLARR
ncbi:MAG TPA: TIGR04222 domain-containing membrane protein, partial [Polyangiales bacterium]|nr:TIGR04222 domain-containing membrane protein [Polyangiales bacterium]